MTKRMAVFAVLLSMTTALMAAGCGSAGGNGSAAASGPQPPPNTYLGGSWKNPAGPGVTAQWAVIALAGGRTGELDNLFLLPQTGRDNAIYAEWPGRVTPGATSLPARITRVRVAAAGNISLVRIDATVGSRALTFQVTVNGVRNGWRVDNVLWGPAGSTPTTPAGQGVKMNSTGAVGCGG